MPETVVELYDQATKAMLERAGAESDTNLAPLLQQIFYEAHVAKRRTRETSALEARGFELPSVYETNGADTGNGFDGSDSTIHTNGGSRPKATTERVGSVHNPMNPGELNGSHNGGVGSESGEAGKAGGTRPTSEGGLGHDDDTPASAV